MKSFFAGRIKIPACCGFNCRMPEPAGGLVLALVLLLSCPAVFGITRYEQLCEEGEAAYKSHNYPAAEKAFSQAVVEAEKLEKSDKRIATTVYNLALVFQAQGNYLEAEKNLLRSLELTTYYYGADNQRVGRVYMDIADLYVEQAGQEGKPELKKKAAEYYQKGIDIFEKIYTQATSEADPDKSGSEPSGKGSAKKTPLNPQEAASDLSNALRVFADSYAEDEQYREAEPLYKRSLELEEYASGAESRDLAKHKARLAEMYCVQGNYKNAEPYFKDALAVIEKVAGPDSHDTAMILYNYGGMHYDQGEFGEAELKFKRALKTFSRDSEITEIDLAQKSAALADVLDMQGKAEEAQAVYKQFMSVFDACEDKNATVRFLKQYQKHLLMQNKKDEAAKVASRIKEIKAAQAKPQ